MKAESFKMCFYQTSVLPMHDFDTMTHKSNTDLSQGLSTANDYKAIICLLLPETYCWHTVATTKATLTQNTSGQTLHLPCVHFSPKLTDLRVAESVQ